MRTRSGTGVSYGRVRVLLADPPAFTPPYDHALAAALARAGADVELVTSRFRFGEAPPPDGYRRRELFYPLSSRLFRRSRLRLPLKAAEHPLGLARCARRGRRPAPPVARRAGARRAPLPLRAPAVFTAHDLLPRRTAAQARSLAAAARPLRPRRRPQRARPRDARDARRRRALRVDPASGLPAATRRATTTAAPCSRFGVIRPYKGLGDAIEAVRRAGDARLLVAGDPLEPVERVPRGARGVDVEWRLGYLPTPSSTARSATRPSRSSRTAPSSTRAARCCARSAPASRRSSTTSAASRSPCALRRRPRRPRRATSPRSRRRSRAPRRPGRARGGARVPAARARAHLGRCGTRAPRRSTEEIV